MHKTLRLPLFAMNIAVYSPVLKDENWVDFIVKTSFLWANQHSEHRFIIITDQKLAESFPKYSNIETILVKPLSANSLLRKIWWDIKLPAILKKAKADLFISSLNICSLGTKIPQIIVIQNAEKIRKSHINKARLLIVPNKLMKKRVIEKFEIRDEKIAVIPPTANKMYGPVTEQTKETIKNKYSGGKEFFLFNSIFPTQKDFIELLRSFSHFKKRQQSNFKLFVIASSNSFFEKSLENYKYRDDVRIMDIKDKLEEALIIGTAYAIVLPFNVNQDMILALQAVRSGTPIITIKNSIINEAFEEAVLYAETDTAKNIGEKMMQVYTDENYRTSLIEKGNQISREYTSEKASELLWQSIIKALD